MPTATITQHLPDLYEVRSSAELYWARSMTEAVRWAIERGLDVDSLGDVAEEDQDGADVTCEPVAAQECHDDQ